MVKPASLKPELSWLKFTVVIVGCALLFFAWTGFVLNNNGWKYPEDLTTDSQGNLYISESSKGQVLKFSPKGDELASFGSSGKGEGQFKKNWGPEKITVDGQGQVYASQNDVTYIQKFDTRGNFLATIEIGQRPRQLLTDSHNNLYVLSWDAPFILKFDQLGKPVESWNVASQTQEKFKSVQGLAFDNQDNLYVLDGEFVKKFDRQGLPVNSWTPKVSANGIKVDRQGRVYLYSFQQIYQFDNQGQLLNKWGGAGPRKEQFRSSIEGIATDPQNNLYTLSVENGIALIKKFDQSGRFVSQWSYGWPQWLSPLLNFSSPLVGVLIVTLGRLAWHWSKGPGQPTRPEKGKPLPEWVALGQSNPFTIYDHLDLDQLTKSKNQSSSISQGSSAGCLFSIALVILILASSISVVSFGLNGYFFNPFTIISGLVALGAVAVIVVAGRKQYQEAKARELQQRELAWQVLDSLPEKNKELFIGSEKAIGLEYNELLNLRIYLLFNLPLALLMIGAYGYGWQSDWFEGWPGWLIQITLVDGLFGVMLVGLWLVNLFQKRHSGKITLNSKEMGSLQAWGWGWLAIFSLMTFALDNLNDSLSSPKQPFDYEFYYNSPTPLGLISSVIKYAFLIGGLVYLPGRWWREGLNKGDYQQSLRRLAYFRSIFDSLALRLTQANLLRMAGRFPEAEYLLQETLAKPLYQEGPYLARILAALGLLRMSQARYAESVFLLENSLQIKPDSDVVTYLAEVYLWLGFRPNRAMQLLDWADANNTSFLIPRSGKPYSILVRQINRALTLAQLGRRVESNQLTVQTLRQTKLKARPELASLYLKTGQIKQLVGEDLQALEYYKRAKEYDPAGIYGTKADQLDEEVWVTSSISSFTDTKPF